MKGSYKGRNTLSTNCAMHRASDAECERMSDAYGEPPAKPWELVHRHHPLRATFPDYAANLTTGAAAHPEDADPLEYARRQRIRDSRAEYVERTEEHDARSAASGLVSLSTSHKPLRISTVAMRLSMLRKRIRWTANYFRNYHAGRPALLTLTYREANGWDAKHVSSCLNHIRNWMKRKGGHKLSYVWVAELQERGAVHFHAVVWLPRGLTLPKPDKQGWWKHGFTNIKWARKPVGYLTKYISKLTTKGGGFPKGLRLHGSGGLDFEVRQTRTWRFLPNWLHVQTTPAMRMARALGGGWVSRETGEVFDSPFCMIGFKFVPGVGRVVHIIRRSEEPSP